MGLRSNTVTTTEALPTIEAIIEGQGAQAPEAPQAKPEQVNQPEPKEESSRLDQIEREQKHRRELFAREKRIKELEAKLGDTSNKASILEEKNPIKAIVKQKKMTQDEIIDMALEAMSDDLTQDEKKADLSKMTPDEIAKLVKEQLDAERSKEAQVQSEVKAVADFKAQITAKAKELAEKHPLVDALGGTDSVFEVINEQFLKDVEDYGQDYAQENMLSIEDAIKKTNETLAKNVKDALQSKHLRDFVLSIIKEDSTQPKNLGQSEDEEQLEDEAVTLTNTGHRPATEAAGKPKFASDEDELNHLINTLI